MRSNIIRLSKKNNRKNGIMEYDSIPFYWESKDKAEESMNYIFEHIKFSRLYNKAKTENEKIKIIDEIKNKPWFFSKINHCENQSKLKDERVKMKEYKEAIKVVALSSPQNDWLDQIFLIQDDELKIKMPVFWEGDDEQFHTAKLMKS